MNAILEQINSVGYRFVEFALPMLIQSCLLIAVLFLADLLLRKKVRAVVRYWLWMLVLLKLILPTTLSSPFSLGSLFGDELASVRVSDTNTAAQPMNLPQITVMETTTVIDTPPAVTKTIVTPPQSAKPMVAEAAGLPAVSQPILTWRGIAFLVWGTVAAAMGLLLLQRATFVCGLVAQAKNPTEIMKDTFRFCCGQIGIKDKVRLKISANTVSPAVCGLFRPVILVPENLAPTLGVGHLRIVLLHELAHIKRGDLWINLVQTVLQIIYFYNPLLWLANSVIRRIREQAVDEAVQVAMGTKAEQYPQTLIDVAKTALSKPVLSLRLIGVVESKSALKSRIKRMLNRPIPKTAKLGTLGLISLLIFAAVFLPMAKAKSKPPEFIIKGIVTDAKTGRPIAGAKVGDDKYASGQFWTTTDANGCYSYKTWYEEHNIKCEASGYKTKNTGFGTKLFSSEKEKVLDFALEPSSSPQDIDYSSVTVEEGVGFDGFVVGDENCTDQFIKSKLGDPDEEHKDKEKGWWINYRKKYGLDFWVNLQENTLYEIRLNKGFKGKLRSGISMSSTKKDVFNVYGQPIREEVVENFDDRFDDRILLFRNPSLSNWLKFRGMPHHKIYYNDKGLLFWFDGDTISQIVVLRKASNCDKFGATLPNNVKVKLIGVCEHPSQGKQWWSPDGTILQNKPSNKQTNFRVSPGRDKQVREVAVQLQGNLDEGVGFRYNIPIAKNSGSSDSIVDTYKDGKQLKAIYGIAFDAPAGSEAADISIGIGAGPWHTVASSTADFQGTTGSRSIVWHQPAAESGKTIITVAHGYRDENVRIAARTKDNTIHASESTSSFVAGSESIRATFEVPLSEIKEFLFQTRPYQWVTFSNVSLRPGYKTNMQVEINEKGKAVDKDKTTSENLEQVRASEKPSESKKQQDIIARREQIFEKLVILKEQRDRVQRDLDVVERALREVCDRWNIYDLEERSYPHPITERLNRLQREKDELALEMSQRFANMENLKEKGDNAGLTEAEEHFQELKAKLETLENMLKEAEKRTNDLDLARTQYKQRAGIRDERLQRLNELKSQIERYRLMYENPEAFDMQVDVKENPEVSVAPRPIELKEQIKTPLEQNPLNEAVYKQLDQIVDLSGLTPDMGFVRALDKLQYSVDPPLKLFVDWQDLFDNAGIEQDAQTNMDAIPSVRLSTALKILLKSVSNDSAELDYAVEDGVIFIGPVDSLPAKFETRVYDISDLIDDDTDENDIAMLIVYTVEPSRWGRGNGTVGDYNKKLVVYQTPEIHKKIRDLLQDLRNSPADIKTEVQPLR